MRLSNLVRAFLPLTLTAATSIEAKKTVRTVQVIAMNTPSSSGADGSPLRKLKTDDEAGRTASPTNVFDFHAHDLSRMWIEFDMDSRFTSSDASVPMASVTDANSFARPKLSQSDFIPRTPNQPPAQIIFVPRWMQGGPTPVGSTDFMPGCAASGYRPSGFLSSAAEGRRFGYYAMMSIIACEYGIPIGLFDAMIIRESRYRADIFSPANAFGLTQLMPGTAARLGVDRYDVEQNLRGGARYLRQQLDRFGQVHLALAAYNAGPSRIRNGLVPQIAETQDYVDRVLLDWQRLAKDEANTPTRVTPPNSASIWLQLLRKPKVSLF